MGLRRSLVMCVAASLAACAGASSPPPSIPACAGVSLRPDSVAGGPNGGGNNARNPVIVNRSEIGRAMEREYRDLLSRNGPNGVGGTVQVWMLIGPSGAVVSSKVQTSAGSLDLDRAALRVSESYRFEPIERGGCAISAWTMLPLTFAVRVRRIGRAENA